MPIPRRVRRHQACPEYTSEDEVTRDGRSAPLTQLSEEARAHALKRFRLLEPHFDGGVPLTQVAREHGIAPRTAQRWARRYRQNGLAGLARTARADRGRRRLPADLQLLIEGLALKKPRPSAASITRQVRPIAEAQWWPIPSYSTVYAIVR